MEEKNLMPLEENNSFIADLTSSVTAFCSMSAETADQKAALFSAMNNPDYRLADFINKTIFVRDVYAEIVNCTNKTTGEVQQCPRIVLIDKDGKGYQCVSLGIFGAVRKLFQVFGTPTWVQALPVTVKQITKGERKMLTLDISK